MKLAIVTDSTCDWSSEEYEMNDVAMIPLKILVDNEEFLDQTEISSEEFYDRMNASEAIPSTSQPSPGDFIEVFSSLVDAGYDAILSMHIASPLSGTYQSAGIAAQSIDIPVEVFDSRNVSSSLGLLVKAACEMRDEGMALDEIMQRLDALASKTHLYLVPENTDNLVKGGRIGKEQAQGAAMLNIKLMFSLDEDGHLSSYDKVKGMKGATKRFVEIAQHHQKEMGPLKIRFMQARNTEEVENLREALDEAQVEYEAIAVDTCGATVATHTGIGVVGFGITSAQW